jgi:hypothetical protein
LVEFEEKGGDDGGLFQERKSIAKRRSVKERRKTLLQLTRNPLASQKEMEKQAENRRDDIRIHGKRLVGPSTDMTRRKSLAFQAHGSASSQTPCLRQLWPETSQTLGRQIAFLVAPAYDIPAKERE